MGCQEKVFALGLLGAEETEHLRLVPCVIYLSCSHRTAGGFNVHPFTHLLIHSFTDHPTCVSWVNGPEAEMLRYNPPPLGGVSPKAGWRCGHRALRAASMY